VLLTTSGSNSIPLAKKVLYCVDHDLLDSQSVYSGLGVDRKILCSHDSDV
jgi:hypothetical protein